VAERGLAALSYLPVPGLAYLVARARPKDELVRHHARQGGLLTIVACGLLVALGLLAGIGPARPVVAAVAAVVLAVAVAGALTGAIGAGRGRFVRLRPLWDVLARS
jgi:hypothetical protein